MLTSLDLSHNEIDQGAAPLIRRGVLGSPHQSLTRLDVSGNSLDSHAIAAVVHAAPTLAPPPAHSAILGDDQVGVVAAVPWRVAHVVGGGGRGSDRSAAVAGDGTVRSHLTLMHDVVLAEPSATLGVHWQACAVYTEAVMHAGGSAGAGGRGLGAGGSTEGASPAIAFEWEVHRVSEWSMERRIMASGTAESAATTSSSSSSSSSNANTMSGCTAVCGTEGAPWNDGDRLQLWMGRPNDQSAQHGGGGGGGGALAASIALAGSVAGAEGIFCVQNLRVLARGSGSGAARGGHAEGGGRGSGSCVNYSSNEPFSFLGADEATDWGD